VRDILATQVEYTAVGTEIGPPDQLPGNERYQQLQQLVNAEGTPSEEVIRMNRKKNGQDYRQELAGEHPVPELRRQK